MYVDSSEALRHSDCSIRALEHLAHPEIKHKQPPCQYIRISYLYSKQNNTVEILLRATLQNISTVCTTNVFDFAVYRHSLRRTKHYRKGGRCQHRILHRTYGSTGQRIAFPEEDKGMPYPFIRKLASAMPKLPPWCTAIR